MKLSPESLRVLGVLLEKESTTPDNYPLTLNSVVLGCNQSTNRNPVVSYDEMTVERALSELREQSLALRGIYAGSRVPKHRHSIGEVFDLSKPALAVLTILILRGEQTLGELNQRTDRIYKFADLQEVDKAVEELAAMEPALVRRIEKLPGHKEGRIAHTLLDPHSKQSASEDQKVLRPAFQLIEGEKMDQEESQYYDDADDELDARVELLEKEVSVLTHEIMSLRAEIDSLRDPSA